MSFSFGELSYSTSTFNRLHISTSSSGLLTLSAAALLTTIALFGPAAAQSVAGPAPTLPGVTVDAPKPMAKPSRPVRAAETAPSRRRGAVRSSATATGGQAATGTGGLNAIQQRIAQLESRASSCNGGCETSFPVGNQPWIGCSLSAAETTPFDGKCSDTLTYAHYADCQETKLLLGWDKNKIWWHCSSLQVGNKFKVAEVRRSRSAR